MFEVIGTYVALYCALKQLKGGTIELLRPLFRTEPESTLDRLVTSDLVVGMGLSSIFTRDFCSLEGTSFSMEKREVASLLFAGAHFYDNLFDIKSDEDFIKLFSSALETGIEPAARHEEERILYAISKRIVELMPPSENSGFYDCLRNAHNAQCDSHRLRFRTDTSLDEVAKFTDEKTGYALVALALIANPAFHFSNNQGTKEGKAKAVYGIGAMLQRADDYIDVHFDKMQGIKTSATEGHLSFLQLRQGFRQVEQQLNSCYTQKQLGPLLSFRVFCSIPYLAPIYRFRHRIFNS